MDPLSIKAAVGLPMHRFATAVLLLTALLAPATQADWASFRGDSHNSGAVPSGTYPVFTDVWWNDKMAGNAHVEATPILGSGIVVVADLGATQSVTTTTKGSVTATSTASVASPVGVVHGLDAESGKELWTYKMTAPIYGTPAIADGKVYVADFKGVLRALDLNTGEKRHEAPNIGATKGSITFHEGKVFVGTEGGEMKAFGADLTPLWVFKMSDYSATSTTDSDGNIKCDTDTKFPPREIRGAPAVFDRKVFFGSYNHVLFAVDEGGFGNGKTWPMWYSKTDDVIVGSPSINMRSDNSVQLVVGAYDGKVYSFPPSPSGEGTNPCYGAANAATWTYEVPSSGTQVSKVHSSPASHLDRVYVGANNGRVYAIDATNGNKVWETTAGSALAPVTASPVYADNKIVVGSQDKKVYWLDAGNGNVLKTFSTQEAVIASPAIDGVRAFVASQDGTVYMFGPEIPKRADLVVSTIRASGGNIQVTVKNQGDAATAGNVTVRFLLSGTFLANVDTKPLGAGEQAVAAVPLPSTSAASVQVKAIADPDNAIAESNDSNNELQQSVSLVQQGQSQTTPKGGGGGIKIPNLALPALLAGLALAAVAMRRRR
jgi:outer membrane protein assembly factor BamB